MALTRRTALTVLASIVGAWTASMTARSQTLTDSSTLKVGEWPPPVPLAFDLSSYSEYRFTLNGKTVVVTPEELYEALESPGTRAGRVAGERIGSQITTPIGMV